MKPNLLTSLMQEVYGNEWTCTSQVFFIKDATVIKNPDYYTIDDNMIREWTNK